jgi:hypothetical protein
MNRIARQSALLVCVVATLAMRAAIPVGYMPASAGSGLLFELCPSAVPAEILMAMSGVDHVHHHGGDNDDSPFNAEQCPIGQMLSVAAAVDVAHVVDEAPNRRSRSPLA